MFDPAMTASDKGVAGHTAIITWFVADDAANATWFPQVGGRSDAPEAQATYWRCTVTFFASSLGLNPGARHMFYTNTRVPRIDGVDLAALFARWRVEVITLPITYRLPRNAVSSWGNQFYVFDVLDDLAGREDLARAIVLDSDCVWRQPVDRLAAAIDANGALTYELDHSEHAEHEAINGLSRAGMARFLARHGGPQRAATPYFGGEIYAARRDVTRAIAARAKALWPELLAGAPDAPREEAHLLSVIYALEGIAPGTANGFIRRMWTTFHHHNLSPADATLAIWHLPAEKKTGFADLFRAIVADPARDPRFEPAAMGLAPADVARAMGWPRRRPAKFARDLSLKLREKIGT